MNTSIKRLLNLTLIFVIIVNLLPQNTLIISAATTHAAVYEYLPMIEEKGSIYYIQRVDGNEYSNDIYRLEVATGNKTKLVSSKYDILNMILHNGILYYTIRNGEKDIDQTYSVSIDAEDNHIVCNGYVLYLDDSSIYYNVFKGNNNKLYKRGYKSKKAALIYSGNMTFCFVKSLDNTLYFNQFNEDSSKLILFTLKPGQKKLTVLTADKVVPEDPERIPIVPDLVKINGDIYYQYGTYEGSGNYWYGTLLKLDCITNKKSVIAKRTYEDSIYHNDSSIFYNENDNSEKHYKYNTKTNKTSSYIYKTTGTESFNILGDKTYCAEAGDKEWISVSRFTSGTNKVNLVNSFIKISYKQKKQFDYSASVKKIGDYLLIPVTCMDYNDTSFGWRGRLVSVTWYVADTDGKVLGQFQ